MERQIINIKLLKAVELIQNDDDTLAAFAEQAENSSPRYTAETALDYPYIYKDDIFAFMKDIKYVWENKKWSYLSTFTITNTIKKFMKGLKNGK